MKKLIETLISYGILLREISDLLLLSVNPETKVMQFSKQELGIIAKNIRKMHEKIKKLENEQYERDRNLYN
jgi:hypothetical protein